MYLREVESLNRRMDEIPAEFRNSGFNSLEYILRVLKSSRTEAELERLQEYKSKSDEWLEIIVNAHKTGLNTSIGSYGAIIEHIQQTQTTLSTLRSNLKTTQRQFALNSKEMLELYSSKETLEYMLHILDKM